MPHSCFYKIRCFLFRQSSFVAFFNLKHRIFCFASLMRGLFCYFSGRLVYLDSFEFPLIGSKVKLHFEEKAKILVINTRKNVLHKNLLPQPFSTGIKIGHRSYWKYINISQYAFTQIKLKKDASLMMHSNTTICPGAYIFVGTGKKLEIKTNSYISGNASIMTHCGLTIGENVLIAHNVTIMDFDGHPIFSMQDSNNTINEASAILIEDNVWIGMNATILKGVKIGKGSVIAANAIVTNDVPANTIVAGNPAKIKQENIIWKPF